MKQYETETLDVNECPECKEKPIKYDMGKEGILMICPEHIYSHDLPKEPQ